MGQNLEALEGVGKKFGEALRRAGVRTVEELLDRAGDVAGRRSLASATGVNEKRILKYVNMADLFRINGVASQYAELLENAGVDTVRELSRRNAGNLTKEMANVNNEKHLVRRAPSTVVVEGWVSQAKKLPAKITY